MSRLLLSGTDSAAQARRLRDAGHEVVLLGGGLDGAQVAAVAVQEDADAIAVTDPEHGAALADELARSGEPAVVVFSITSH